MSSKRERHDAILKVIREQRVSSQEGLCDLLAEIGIEPNPPIVV